MIGEQVNAHWWLIPMAYLLGSIPFGYVLVRLREGRDIRSAGSGNIGAANVAREAGLATGLATLALDAGKGVLAVWLTARVTGQDFTWMILAALATLCGHIFPVWLRFHGGRGVATAAGVFWLISWQAVVAAAGIWFLFVVFWRYVSLGSIAAAAALPLLVYLFYAPRHAPPLIVSAGTLLAAGLVIWRHYDNLLRLLEGTEPRIRLRK